jgi:hypothetical protein
VAASAATLTAFDVVMSEELPNWGELREKLWHNLCTVALLHSVSLSLAKMAPGLTPDAAIAKRVKDLNREVEPLLAEQTALVLRHQAMLERNAQLARLPSGHSDRVAMTEKALALYRELAALTHRSNPLLERFASFYPSAKEANQALQAAR